MKNFIYLIAFSGLLGSATAQDEKHSPKPAWENEYRATATRINDLVHTKLAVRFDYNHSWMYGKAWITLQPHFYPTDSLTLDAKGMEISEIDLVKGKVMMPLKYTYDSMLLKIKLDKIYKAGEKYTVSINYVSRPNDLKQQGSAAITDAKGLYFINPKGEDSTRPTEIWTQGETESNSAWFPTIDKPNQKSTEEIDMTVPSKYVTLSNGLLKSQKKNADGTRTDYWKMDLPHAPYLFFMGVGYYVIVKDHYKKLPVDYYVEKEYAPVAKRIFGETPAMMAFFEKITGVPFPWPKYDQIVGRDYVSGAMENTTATLHQENAYQDARQLSEGNAWEEVIAHELFHHWFGDLVTAESWSNITLNESFADYSETLWDTYRHGKDAGDEHLEENRQNYLGNPDNESKNLVRFYYENREDVFDGVSYDKGGAILAMLRNYVGDSAFFKSLHLYLETYKFKSAEAQELRLAFEAVTGKDLNWFWNEWYYGSGQPDLTITYGYKNKTAMVVIDQTQKTGKIFEIPTAIEVYSEGNNRKRYNVWIENKSDTFYFPSDNKPSFINVDADKVLLCRKTDNKTADEFIQQWKYAPNYLDRSEALQYFAAKGMKELAEGLHDSYAGLRDYTLKQLEQDTSLLTPEVLANIETMVKTDSSKKVIADAIAILANQENKNYQSLFAGFVDDSSYTVSGNALEAIFRIDYNQAYTEAKRLSAMPSKGKLAEVIGSILSAFDDESGVKIIINYFKSLPMSQQKMDAFQSMNFALSKTKSLENFKAGVNALLDFNHGLSPSYHERFGYIVPEILKNLEKVKQKQLQIDQLNYVQTALKSLQP